jgi:hypothetical protein
VVALNRVGSVFTNLLPRRNLFAEQFFEALDEFWRLVDHVPGKRF